jgi:predicted HAD superfamily hydrolase
MNTDFLNSYKEMVDRYSTISFDLFDTLIERPTLHPADLFNLMKYEIEKTVGVIQFDFKTIRQLAEKNAYKNARLKNQEEINFNKIYIEFKSLTNFSDKVIEHIKSIEKKYEYNYSLSKKIGLELLQYCLTKNKQILIISDTYFDKDFILQLLKKHNYKVNPSNIFLSSEIGFKKTSGLIYKFVLSSVFEPNNLSIKDNWLHIGDNEISDIINAKALGIDTLYIASNIENYTNNIYFRKIFNKHKFNSHFHHNFLHGAMALKPYTFDQNRVFSSVDDLGYWGFGPLVLGFTQWLIQKSIRDGVKNLYFLARDGKVMKDAYDKISKFYDNAPKSYYILASRKSSNTIKLTNFYEIHNILKVPYTDIKISDLFIQRFSLDINNHMEILLKHKYNQDSLVSQSKDNDSIIELLKELSPFIFAQAEYEKKLYIKYLNNNGLPSLDKSAVVDIGYSGTMQATISQVLNQPIDGYYLLTFYDALDKVYMYGNSISGYLGNFDNKFRSNNGFTKKIPLYETLFSSEETSFLGFNEVNGNLVAKFQEKEVNEINRINFVNIVQKNAINYVQDFTNLFKYDLIHIYFDPELCILPLNYFFNNSAESKPLLKNIYFEDKYSGAVLAEVNSYYQEVEIGIIRHSIIFMMSKFLSHKKSKKLKNNPAKFFLDSKKPIIKLVGKIFFGIK